MPFKRILDRFFRNPLSEKNVHQIFTEFMQNPEKYADAAHKFRISNSAFKLPVGKDKFVVIKKRNDRDKPINQFRANNLINQEMEKRNPKNFFYEPYKIYSANENFLVAELVKGVSLKELYQELIDFNKTKQAGHFVKNHPHLTAEQLTEVWREASNLIIGIGERNNFRGDDKDRNMMIRGTWDKKPVLTFIDQG